MAVPINRILAALEGRIFSYGLALCTVFRLIRSVNEFSTGQSQLTLSIGLVNLALLIAMMTVLRRYKTFCFILLHSMFMITTWITWESSGGYQGIIPYAIIAMMAFAIFSSHAVLLAVTLIAYSVLIIYLTQGRSAVLSYSDPTLVTLINFLLCTSLLITLCVYAKNRFLRYREYVQAVNKRLDASAAILSEQAMQLRVQGEQLRKLRNHLESQIIEKHIERDQKRAMLSKYAYVNAHHVRGPLARILGLIQLIEKERMPRDRRRNLEAIKSDAHEIDGVIRKISEVLSD